MAVTFHAKSMRGLQRKYMQGDWLAGPGQFTDSGNIDIQGVAGTVGAVADQLASYQQELEAKGARSWRQQNIFIHRAIRYLTEQVSGAKWSLRQKDPSVPWSMDEQDAVDEIRALIESPNPQLENNSMGGMQHMSNEDLLTLNRSPIQKLLYKPDPGMTGDEAYQYRPPYALKVLDAAIVTPRPDWDGTPSKPRYDVDRGGNREKAQLYNNQLSLLLATSTTYDWRGVSPITVLNRFLQAELATFRRMHLTMVQATPGGIFMTGGRPDVADALAEEYETNIQGNAGVVFMSAPGGEGKFIEIGSANLAEQGAFSFYDILLVGHAIAYGLPPMILGREQDVNKAYGSVAEGLAYDGVVNLLRLWMFYYNTEIIPCWGERAKNIRLSYDQLETEEEAEEAGSLRTKAGAKDFIRVSELRTAGGLPEIEDSDVPPGCKPFLDDLWVKTVIPTGNAAVVVELPWTYWFKFMGVDPKQTEIIPGGFLDQKLNPPPPPAPVQMIHEGPLEGGNGLPDAALPATHPALVQKRLLTMRKALTTERNPKDTLDQLEDVQHMLDDLIDSYVPPEDEDDEEEER